MSRCCEITICVREYDSNHINDIVDSVTDLGYEADFDIIGDRLQFCSETINICAGHTDESVAREVVEGIWRANGAFCKVDVGIRDLDINFSTYSWDEASFDKGLFDGNT